MTRIVIAIVLAVATRSAAAQPSIDTPPAHVEPGAREASGTDRRPLYVVAGVVVLVALMLWNRRHRAELDRRSEDETRRIREAARARRAAHADDADAATEDEDDPDATDLAAAARPSSDQEPS